MTMAMRVTGDPAVQGAVRGDAPRGACDRPAPPPQAHPPMEQLCCGSGFRRQLWANPTGGSSCRIHAPIKLTPPTALLRPRSSARPPTCVTRRCTYARSEDIGRDIEDIGVPLTGLGVSAAPKRLRKLAVRPRYRPPTPAEATVAWKRRRGDPSPRGQNGPTHPSEPEGTTTGKQEAAPRQRLREGGGKAEPRPVEGPLGQWNIPRYLGLPQGGRPAGPARRTDRWGASVV